MGVHDQIATWERRPADLPGVPRLDRVLLGDPAAFALEQALNPHMIARGGGLHALDLASAQEQWEALADAYRGIGIAVEILPPAEGLADFCFTANPSLVLPLPDGSREMWLARMSHPSRAGEVALHRAFAERNGLPVRELPAGVAPFEGTGDGLLHPGRFLIHAGHGFRTAPEAWEALAAAHPELDVLRYRLVDERFYHLDTALAPLDETTALYVPAAFEPAGLALLRAAFPDALAVPLDEALRFAANAHCPDGRHVLIQSGCPRTESLLRDHGFTVIPLETAEFRKSGGSVFCLKLAY